MIRALIILVALSAGCASGPPSIAARLTADADSLKASEVSLVDEMKAGQIPPQAVPNVKTTVNSAFALIHEAAAAYQQAVSLTAQADAATQSAAALEAGFRPTK